MKKSYKKVVNPIYQPNDLLDYMFTEENIQKLIIYILKIINHFHKKKKKQR